MNNPEKTVFGRMEDPVLLQTIAENRKMALAMAEQGHQSILIMSRSLEGPIYGTSPFIEAMSRLVRSNRNAYARILVAESGGIDTQGHRLVELSQKLSSAVQIRRLSETHREFNQAFLVVDSRGFIFRNAADRYDAECSFNQPRRARALRKLFQDMWDAAEIDPSFLRLHL